MKGPKKSENVADGIDFVSLIRAFEKEKGWVKFQIDSFDHFVDHGLQEIINEIGTVELMPELGDAKLRRTATSGPRRRRAPFSRMNAGSGILLMRPR